MASGRLRSPSDATPSAGTPLRELPRARPTMLRRPSRPSARPIRPGAGGGSNLGFGDESDSQFLPSGIPAPARSMIASGDAPRPPAVVGSPAPRAYRALG